METLKILLTGDLMPGGEFETLVNEGTLSINHAFAEVQPLFIDSDLVIANLECPIREGNNLRKDKSSILGCSEFILPYLKKWKFQVLNLANNHIHDYGHQGITNTLRNLEQHGLIPLGIVSKEKNLKNCVRKKIKNITIGFAAFTSDEPWVKSRLDDETFKLAFYSRANVSHAIASLRQGCDFVILLMHWGFENHEYPSPQQLELARFCIDEGADVIVGHHSHIIQGYQVYKNKPIFFSLGHLFFSNFYYRGGALSNWQEKNRLGLMVKLALKEKGEIDFKLVPIFQNDHFKIQLLKHHEQKKILEKIERISAKLEISAKEYWQSWKVYHYNLNKSKLIRKIKTVWQNPGIRVKKKAIKIAKLFLLLVIELCRRVMSTGPGKAAHE
jgi:poly-gamma-glutamate synthesis protein (capsule biosynthesis protein)